MDKNEIQITTYDKLLRAWENTVELVRDFELYSKEINEDEIRQTFEKFAEEQGFQASRLRELIIKYQVH